MELNFLKVVMKATALFLLFQLIDYIPYTLEILFKGGSLREELLFSQIAALVLKILLATFLWFYPNYWGKSDNNQEHPIKKGHVVHLALLLVSVYFIFHSLTEVVRNLSLGYVQFSFAERFEAIDFRTKVNILAELLTFLLSILVLVFIKPISSRIERLF